MYKVTGNRTFEMLENGKEPNKKDYGYFTSVVDSFPAVTG